MADEQFDPTQFGAVAVDTPPPEAFDPTQHGAIPIEAPQTAAAVAETPKQGGVVSGILSGLGQALNPINLVKGALDIGQPSDISQIYKYGKTLGEIVTGKSPDEAIGQNIPELQQQREAVYGKLGGREQAKALTGIGLQLGMTALPFLHGETLPRAPGSLAEVAEPLIPKPDIAQPSEPVATDAVTQETVQPTEKITQSAFKLPNGEVVGTGPFHQGEFPQGSQAGFQTTLRPFVSRDEAGQIATGLRQPLFAEDFVTNHDIVPSLLEHPIAESAIAAGAQKGVPPFTEVAPSVPAAESVVTAPLSPETTSLGKVEPVAPDLPTGTGEAGIRKAIDAYDYDPNHSGAPQLANDLENVPNLPKPVQKALADFRDAEKVDREQYGERSGLPEQYGNELERVARQHAGISSEPTNIEQPISGSGIDVSQITNAKTQDELRSAVGGAMMKAKTQADITAIKNASEAWSPVSEAPVSTTATPLTQTEVSTEGGIENATQEGQQQESSITEHPGVPQGSDLPAHGEEVRQGQGERAGGSGSVEPAAQEQVAPPTEPPTVTEAGAPISDDQHVSTIANRFTEERTKSGELGEIAPGQGYSTREMADAGLKMTPEQINQHVSDLMNGTGDPIEQGKAVRAEEARLSQRSNELSRAASADPTNTEARLAADNAFKDVTDFHNGPVAKLKTIFHATGVGLQGELPVDLSTFNGLREKFLRDTGKSPTPEQEPQLRTMAEKVTKSVAEDNGAKQNLGQAIDKATSRRKLPTYDEVRQNIADRMKIEPCRA